MPKSKSAFTLIELLVVIAIIGLLVTLSVLALSNARVSSRDAKRVSDVKQIQSALELFFDANNRYPTNLEFQSGSLKSFASSTGTTTYMSIIPAAPTPNDGSCSASDNNYVYNASTDGSAYTLNFCLAKKINDLPLGNLIAIPGGITYFKCGDTLVYAGDTYPTINIGTQCWLAKNLSVGTMILGSIAQANNSIIEKYCFNNATSSCTTYGGLYQWGETVQYLNGASNVADWSPAPTGNIQGICPSGWHIPTHDEWTTLERAVCTSGTCAANFPYDYTATGWRGTNEGTKLKAGGISGFNGALAGSRSTGGVFTNQGSVVDFWSSSVSDANAWGRNLNISASPVYRDAYSRANGYSVRCLRD